MTSGDALAKQYLHSELHFFVISNVNPFTVVSSIMRKLSLQALRVKLTGNRGVVL